MLAELKGERATAPHYSGFLDSYLDAASIRIVRKHMQTRHRAEFHSWRHAERDRERTRSGRDAADVERSVAVQRFNWLCREIGMIEGQLPNV